MDNININTERFRQNLVKLINEAGIPVSNAYLVFQDVQKQLEQSYYETINRELKEEAAADAAQVETTSASEEKAE